MIGSLYTSPRNLILYKSSDLSKETNAFIIADEPFVILELKAGWGEDWNIKVLTTKGEVGWINMLYIEDLEEVTQP